MAPQSPEMCSDQQVLQPCIIQPVTSFKSPLKFTQGNKGTRKTGGSTRLGNSCTGNTTSLFDTPAGSVSTHFSPRTSKLGLCILKPKSQLGLETVHFPSCRPLSGWLQKCWVHSGVELCCTQPHLVPHKEMCPICSMKLCGCSWLCPTHGHSLTPQGFDTAMSSTPVAMSTDPLP